MGKKLFWLFDILILIIFLKLIKLTFNLTSSTFAIHFIALLILLALGIFTINNAKFSIWFFVLSLIDTLILYSHFDNRIKFVVIPLGAGVIGLALSLLYKEEDVEDLTQEYDMKKEEPETKVLLEEYTPDKEAKFSPGKLIASKFGKTYHAPKCTWAKKIKKKSQVWFKDAKEASRKGYTKHNCL